MAATITSILSVMLGGVFMAVQTARAHTEGMEEAAVQAQAAIDRIGYMVSRAGVYQMSGRPTTLGVAVVTHWRSSFEVPDTLVVWSGGRTGGMADRGIQTDRLPRLDELLVYTPDPNDPRRLVETSFPGQTASIDFNDPAFEETIRSLVASSSAERTLLCDRVRVSSSPMSGASAEAPNVRFEVESSPDETALSTVTPGTAEWNELRWAQSVVSGDSGLRTANVRIELQVDVRVGEPSDTGPPPPTLPYFGSASYRYTYRPD